MLKKEMNLNLISSALFVLAGVIELIAKQTIMGFVFIALGLSLFVIRRNTVSKALDFSLVEKDSEFQALLLEGNKIKAVKRCRIILNCGLKEAFDYVESLK